MTTEITLNMIDSLLESFDSGTTDCSRMPEEQIKALNNRRTDFARFLLERKKADDTEGGTCD